MLSSGRISEWSVWGKAVSYEMSQPDFVFLVRHLWLPLLAFSLFYPPIAALSAFAYRPNSGDGYRQCYVQYMATYGLVATSVVASASLIYVFWDFIFLPLPVLIYALYRTGKKKWRTFFVVAFELALFLNLFEPIGAIIAAHAISHGFSRYPLSILALGASSFFVLFVYRVMLPKIARTNHRSNSGTLP